MRRLVVPVLLLLACIAALVQANRADGSADPGRATATSTDPALVTPILSARRAPEWLRSPKSDALLTAAVRGVLTGPDAPDQSCVVVERDGERLASSGLTTSLYTAEMQRLITAAVIDSVGTGGGFRTEIAIARDAEVVVDEEAGTAELVGDVWLIGGGDPGLSTAAYRQRTGDDGAYTDFEQLADDLIAELQSRNITSIDGRIYGDETKYDPPERDYYRQDFQFGDETFPVWDRRAGETNEVGPLSALLLDDGFDSWPDDDPDRAANERADDPAVAAAAALDQRLEEAGISVRSSPRSGQAPPLAEREELAVAESPPLTDIIAQSLGDATTAEMLLKEYGIRAGSTSERAGVIFVLAASGLSSAGLPFDITDGTTVYADGSGRSEVGRTTCEMIHATVADADGIGADIVPPAADTPLAACSTTAPGELHVFGTADETITGLAGWYLADNGERLSFTLLADDPIRAGDPSLGVDADGNPVAPEDPYDFCNPLQTAMLDAIIGHPYGPDLDDLGPLSPG